MKFAAGLLLAGLFIASCTRDNGIAEPVLPPKGGKGGKAILEVTPKHHGKDIDSGTVYIKYGVLTGPVLDGYDDTVYLPKDGSMTAKFDSLKWGNYFLNVHGFDKGFIVAGTASFSVVDSSVRTYNTVVSVTETDGSNH
jgi:hypothetical protein